MHISQGRGRGPEQPASAQGEKMGIGHRSARVGFVGLAATVLVAASMFAGAAATIAANAPGAGATHITLIGHGTLVPKGSTGTSSGTGLEVAPEPQVDAAIPHTGGGTIRVPAAQVPKPAPTALGALDPSGFVGLSHRDQRLAGTGVYVNTQFSLEPPDQMLCVGGTYVVEGVNNALRVHDTGGNALTDPTAFSQFWGLAPEINRTTGVYGPFISDPKCYYDAGTNRFFVTELKISTDASTGAFGNSSAVLLAVSAPGDPTGAWNIYSIDTTDSAVAGHSGCPCFGDQPLIGADANGFYVSTNEFSIAGPEFNGAQVYALDKTALATGASTVNQVAIDAGLLTTPDPGGIWYTIQPATTPPGGSYALNTEYFLSALQFGPSNFDNRIAVWALTGTDTLSSTTPNVSLSRKVIASEVYGMPPASDQKGIVSAALTPLAYSLKQEKLDFLDTNDDRMNQVVYADGKLWSGLNTAVAGNGPTRSGIAWFVVTPSVSGGAVNGAVTRQGYIALQQDTVMFPSIGVNAAGKGVVAFSIGGPDFYPSTGYATIDLAHGVGPVHVAGAGAGPDDGFSGYATYGGSGRVARWGDYSAAVAAADGSIWSAAEYIPGGQRTPLANWGTYVSHVTP